MDIKELCYKLYKMDWMQRISADRQMDALKNYYQETPEEDRSNYTFRDFICENGYDGELYVCFSEFSEAEFLDKEYIRGLLDNEELFAEYETCFKKKLNEHEVWEFKEKIVNVFENFCDRTNFMIENSDRPKEAYENLWGDDSDAIANLVSSDLKSARYVINAFSEKIIKEELAPKYIKTFESILADRGFLNNQFHAKIFYLEEDQKKELVDKIYEVFEKGNMAVDHECETKIEE